MVLWRCLGSVASPPISETHSCRVAAGYTKACRRGSIVPLVGVAIGDVCRRYSGSLRDGGIGSGKSRASRVGRCRRPSAAASDTREPRNPDAPRARSDYTSVRTRQSFLVLYPADSWPMRGGAVNNHERLERVRTQIQLRLDTLHAWTCDGIPSAKQLPRSLNQVRCWEDPDLGISKIGSSGTFTTKHTEHGASVVAIAEVLEVLLKRDRETKPKEPSFATQLKDERRGSAALKKTLENAASGYAAMTVRLEETSRDLRVTRQSLDSANARISDLVRELEEVRRQPDKFSKSENVTPLRPRRST